MSCDLPDEFDLIVIGTGFTESCVAAAASRIGKSVLHLDSNRHYGGAFASFNLEALDEFLKNNNNLELINCKFQYHSSGSETENVPEQYTKDALHSKSKYFNIDLCPKLLFADGELVNLLIKSNICRYVAFREVDRVCTRFNGAIVNVPCSRTHAFKTKDLTLVEKRLLMKFLLSCNAYDGASKESVAQFADKTFVEFLREQRLTDRIASCIMQAIAMCNEQTSFEEGMARTKKFLTSVGRFGNTPFLYPMYGCGELPQSFCRLCAVFGGVYCLDSAIGEINYDNARQELALQFENKHIRTKYLVASHGHVAKLCGSLLNAANQSNDDIRPNISRSIILATKPVPNSEEDQHCGGGVTLLRLMSGLHEATLIQLSHFSGTVCDGLFIYHISTPALSNDPESDIKPFLAQIFTDSIDSYGIVYSAYFTLTAAPVWQQTKFTELGLPIFCAAAPYNELDYDLSIKNARDLFNSMYPTEDFLPRAPDPEEIVMEGEDPLALNVQQLPDDVRAHIEELERQTAAMHLEQTKTMDTD